MSAVVASRNVARHVDFFARPLLLLLSPDVQSGVPNMQDRKITEHIAGVENAAPVK